MGKALTQWKANSTGLSEAAVLREIALESPLGRHAREGDIAAAAAYFLSDDASFVTGAVLDVDGGSHFATPAGLPMGQSS
jgi:sorbitol-6-phosphate 2-dehydrogenase/meso-butanediol dehydrogenase/(S,S)-butanediol dehydrogenase/diacetyl reductase